MKTRMNKRQTFINLIMNTVAFAVQFVISFYISPLIVSNVGASAYGFIGVATDFVSYASIIATVFNSVASRFIADAFYRKDYKRANDYFNSLIVTNIIIVAVLGLAGMILVPNLDKILTIPINLLFDVKLTFALVFLAYIVQLVTLVFTTSTFVTNRTDIQGGRNIIQYIVRFALIIVFLNFVSIRIYWVAFASLVATIVVAIMNVGLTKSLTPELKISIKGARKEYAIELGKAGCWMALTSISTILLRGLDLTVANILIGDYEMGLLSIARTMPNNVTSIINTMAPIFTPVFLANYSIGNLSGVMREVKDSIKIMALLLFVPISGFIVFSYDFYALWQKSLSHEELVIVTALSIITVVQAYFNSTTATMAQLSVVVNKLKLPVIVSFICGVVSVIAEIYMIVVLDLGLYGIVLSTTIVMILRYVFFNSFYAAWCLKEKKAVFLPETVKTWLSIPLLLGFMYLVRKALPISSWVDFLIDVAICGFLGYLFMVLFYGRKYLGKFLKGLKKGNG